MKGVIKSTTQIDYIDLEIQKGKVLRKTIKPEWNTFIALYEGEVRIQNKNVNSSEVILFENCKEERIVEIEGISKQSQFLWISGLPLNEELERGGLFVMNTKEEIIQARHDYFNFKNGFEKAKNWESKIKDKMKHK